MLAKEADFWDEVCPLSLAPAPGFRRHFWECAEERFTGLVVVVP